VVLDVPRLQQLEQGHAATDSRGGAQGLLRGEEGGLEGVGVGVQVLVLAGL